MQIAAVLARSASLHPLSRRALRWQRRLLHEAPGAFATVNKSLAHLERISVVGELTNRQRGRVFSYGKYVKELAAEMESP
jgi:hypothetical protein